MDHNLQSGVVQQTQGYHFLVRTRPHSLTCDNQKLGRSIQYNLSEPLPFGSWTRGVLACIECCPMPQQCLISLTAETDLKEMSETARCLQGTLEEKVVTEQALRQQQEATAKQLEATDNDLRRNEAATQSLRQELGQLREEYERGAGSWCENQKAVK